MPEPDGIEVCQMIKTDDRLKDIPVLMLTSASEVNEKVRGFKAGADDYLIKPYVVEELIARIACHIRSADLVRQLKMQIAERHKAEIELSKAKDELEIRVQKRTCELESANAKLTQERQQLEQIQAALRESEEILKALVNNVPGMVYKAYSDWSAEIFSGCIALCEYSEKEVNEREGSWLSIIHPDDKEAVFRDGSRLCQAPQVIVQTYRIICKSGDIRWVEDRKASFFSEDGAFLGIYGIVFDVTERKQMERALQASERRFQSLINTMNEGLVEVDENWTMTFVNNRFAEMTGFGAEQLVGRRFQDLVSKEFKGIARDEMICRKKGYTGSYELELVRANAQKIFVHCSPKPSYDAQGKYLGGIGVVADITVRKNAELQLLREKEKLEDALAKIKTLSGLLPICANCKKIRDDKGYWNQIENYISLHSDVLFSHSVCPDCIKQLYPNMRIGTNTIDEDED
jgi:PAS domain S-box-containing protein